MDRYQETFQTWDKIAAQYEALFMDLDLYNDTYDAFCALIPQTHPAILEIGCGPGNITRYLLTQRPDFRITAIDISPNMVALAQQHNPDARFLVMDSRRIAELHTPFDAIICGFCLPYLSESDSDKLIDDCSGLMPSAGVLYLSFIEGNSHNSGFQTGSGGDRVYFYYHSCKRLETTLKAHGFTTMRRTDKPYRRKDGTTETHTILLAQR